MKAEELRIGNLLMTLKGNSMPTGAIIEVSEIVASEIGAENLGVGKGISATIFISHLSYFEPIPLDVEWLRKFGFTKFDHHFSQNSIHEAVFHKEYISGDIKLLFSIWKYREKYSKEPFFYIKAEGQSTVCCVHQLQNLYFALTGEELTMIP